MKCLKIVAKALMGCIIFASLVGCGAKESASSELHTSPSRLLRSSASKDLSVDIAGDGNSVNMLNNVADFASQAAKQGYEVYISGTAQGIYGISSDGKLPEKDSESGHFENPLKITELEGDSIKMYYTISAGMIYKADAMAGTEKERVRDEIKYGDVARIDVSSGYARTGENASKDILEFFPQIEVDVESESEYVDGEAIALDGDRTEDWEEILARKGLFIFDDEMGVVYFDDKRVTGEDYLDVALKAYEEYKEFLDANGSAKTELEYVQGDYFLLRGMMLLTSRSHSDLGNFVAAEMLRDGFDKLHSGEIGQITCLGMWVDSDEQGIKDCGFNRAAIYRLYEEDLVVGLYNKDLAEKMADLYK